MSENGKDMEQQSREEQSMTGQGGEAGNTSYAGSTSTDLDKARIQRVDENEQDTGEGMGQRNNVRNEEDEDIIDSGSVRTAAFDEGNEPRDPESLRNRGTTLGSDDTPTKRS